jgi:hypothetical protein
MELERRRVPAGRRLAAEGLGHGADVVGPPPQQIPMYSTPIAAARVANSAISKRVHWKGSSWIGNRCRPSADSRASNAGVASVVWKGTGWAATGTSTADRISSSRGSMVSGPREQLSPTTAAPRSASRRQAST